MAKQRVTNCTADWGVESCINSDGFTLIIQDPAHKIRVTMDDHQIYDLIWAARRVIKERQAAVNRLKDAFVQDN